MAAEKSITGRTKAEVHVGEKGDVKVRVFRNGQCVEAFDLPVEDGMSTHANLRRKDDGSVELWMPGAHGLMQLVETFHPDAEEVSA